MQIRGMFLPCSLHYPTNLQRGFVVIVSWVGEDVLANFFQEVALKQQLKANLGQVFCVIKAHLLEH